MSIKRFSGAGLTTPKSSRLWDQTTFQSGMFALATVSLTTTASSIVFSDIPADYKHLQIRTIARSNGSATNICLTFNGDTNNANYYARHLLYGDGTSALTLSGQTLTGITTGSVSPNTTSLVAPNIIDLLDYSNSSKNKTLRSLGGYDANGSGFIILASGLWMNTAAINSINITCFSGSFTEHTQFALYGIKSA
jgi:hypothetical protein